MLMLDAIKSPCRRLFGAACSSTVGDRLRRREGRGKYPEPLLTPACDAFSRPNRPPGHDRQIGDEPAKILRADRAPAGASTRPHDFLETPPVQAAQHAMRSA